MPLDRCIASPLSCPAKAGHPVITENLVVTGSPAFAGDDDREVNDPSEKSSLSSAVCGATNALRARRSRRRACRIVQNRRARSRRFPRTARIRSAWGPRRTTVRPDAFLGLSVCPPREHQKVPLRALFFINERSAREFPPP